MGLFASCNAIFKPCQEKTCHFAYAKKKGAIQLRGYHRLCFRYIN